LKPIRGDWLPQPGCAHKARDIEVQSIRQIAFLFKETLESVGDVEPLGLPVHDYSVSMSNISTGRCGRDIGEGRCRSEVLRVAAEVEEDFAGASKVGLIPVQELYAGRRVRR
jgi:hypothetical protein